ncbi:MAG: hypothetical protein SGI74_11250 [Oligoflexia bacterium]|nr:hypothetical protein [Oligoflexia bacterium]
MSFILGSLKDEEAGRVGLYHYLKNFSQPQDPVTPDLLNQFFADCLQLPHWQEKKTELYTDIHDLLQRFFSQVGASFMLDQLWNLPRLQLLMVTQIENLYITVRNYEQSFLKEGENLRLIPEGDNRIVAIRKNAQSNVAVRTYNNLVRIQGSSILPLGPDQELHYDAGLELLPQHIQKLKPAPHSQVRFLVHPSGVEAQFISGFAFRQSQVIKITAISQEPRIFYPLKRLERFYVHRPSDPYYMELITTLDRAIHAVRTHTQGTETFVRQAFEGGQIAFDQIFPDDKALYMRLKELAKLMSGHAGQVSL